MTSSPDHLYELLPAIIRQQDAHQGYPLRALLRIINEQVDAVEDDITQLYDNWFIETCQDWVVPYIGDLIGYTTASATRAAQGTGLARDPLRDKVLYPRREVANTLHYRRRKGTLAVLEELAQDITGWPVRAVEFYKLLAWAQNINHLRPTQGRTVDMRQTEALATLNSAFDTLAHTVDVRRISAPVDPGRYNLPNVGVFVWRLKVFGLTTAPAYCFDNRRVAYCFSILGNDTPLYTRPQPDRTSPAGRLALPLPITRHNLETYKGDYYGPDKSLYLWKGVDGVRERSGEDVLKEPIGIDAIAVADLTDWHYQSRDKVLIDPELGRIRLPSAEWGKHGIWVSYHYGFSAPIGGGEYPRTFPKPPEPGFLEKEDLKRPTSFVAQFSPTPSDRVSLHLRQLLSPDLQAALDAYTNPTPAAEAPTDENPIEEAPTEVPPPLLEPLLLELNHLMGQESLYNDEIFDWDLLRPETQTLVQMADLEESAVIARNRYLLEDVFPEDLTWHHKTYPVGSQQRYTTLNQALTAWAEDNPRQAVIEILESEEYVEQLTIRIPAHRSLEIRAANLTRPVIREEDWRSNQPDAVWIEGEVGSRLKLDGIMIAGRPLNIAGKFKTIEISHTTLVPGWKLNAESQPEFPEEPSLVLECDPTDQPPQVTIENSVVGSIFVDQDPVATDPVVMVIANSVVDATHPELAAMTASDDIPAHARLHIENCTIFGQVNVHAIDLAENSLFYGTIYAQRQQGCIRFSYVEPGSRTPRRYCCQPDLAEAAKEQALNRLTPIPTQAEIDAAKAHERQRVRPQFTLTPEVTNPYVTRYGTPTYAQLAPTCAEEIRRGAEDESEMGVFHNLYQPQRLANLQARLEEYVPAGMDIGILIET